MMTTARIVLEFQQPIDVDLNYDSLVMVLHADLAPGILAMLREFQREGLAWSPDEVEPDHVPPP